MTQALAFSSKNLALRYPGPPALTIFEGLSLDVETGEFLTILGGSGVGKSTLMRILAGLDKPSEGALDVMGKTVAGVPEGVVMVFQDYSRSLLPWRTVLGNVLLGIEAHMPKREAKDIATEALELVGLAQVAAFHPAQLSGGMQQRLQIARALAMRPQAICMDEPFGALDALTKANLQDQLRHIHQSTGVTFLFVTHDVDEAVYLGDRAIVMSGRPATIVDDIRIDLGSERNHMTTKADPRFLEYRSRLHTALGHEGH